MGAFCVWWDAAGPGSRRDKPLVNSPFYASFPIPMAIVVPLTTQDRGLPHHVPVSSAQSGLHRPSWARTHDIRAISERRLTGGPLGTVGEKEADDIRSYLRLMLDI